MEDSFAKVWRGPWAGQWGICHCLYSQHVERVPAIQNYPRLHLLRHLTPASVLSRQLRPIGCCGVRESLACGSHQHCCCERKGKKNKGKPLKQIYHNLFCGCLMWFLLGMGESDWGGNRGMKANGGREREARAPIAGCLRVPHTSPVPLRDTQDSSWHCFPLATSGGKVTHTSWSGGKGYSHRRGEGKVNHG